MRRLATTAWAASKNERAGRIATYLEYAAEGTFHESHSTNQALVRTSQPRANGWILLQRPWRQSIPPATPSPMKTPWLVLFCFALAVPGNVTGEQTAANVFEIPGTPVPVEPIDRLVAANLTKLGIRPLLCSDAVFVRRVHLDVIGTLPTAREAREFIQDPDHANKRRKLIDRLLERNEYADLWAMRWGDVLRIKAEFPVNLWPNAAQAYHRWVRASIAGNKPYDQFARELLTSSGSNFRVGQVNFYRAIQNRKPDGIAIAVALTFMGARADTWPADQLDGMAAFFAQIGYKPTNEWKEEHVFWDPLGTSTAAGNSAPGRAAIAPPPATPAPKPGASATPTPPPAPAPTPAAAPAATPCPPTSHPRFATFPDGRKIELPPDRDPRELFADWLLAPNNPWFARSVCNRLWAWLLGRGIIHEPDDIRPDNPPSNPELLAYLEGELTASRYDLKHLLRLILNSQTYQSSAMPRFLTPEAEANFASYPLRRLDAEVLIDAINKITGTSDLYTSAIPEPFTYIPADQPAVALPDGSITSPFLALFGRSARATGMAGERDNKTMPAQWLHLLNSSHIQRKLEQSETLKTILEPSRKPSAIIEDLYLTILSRFPTPDEIRIIGSYGLVKPGKPPTPAKPAAPGQAPQAAKPVDPNKPAVPNTPPAASKPATPNPAPAAAKPADPNKPATTNPPAQPNKPAAATPAKPPAPPPVVVKRREDWLDLAWSLINSTEFLYRH